MLVIDSDNYAAAGIETLFFPGGEPHAKVPRFTDRLVLHLKLRTWADCGIAGCVLNALQYQGASFRTFIPYFPGGRQDRTDGTAPLTVNIMRDLLAYGPLWVFDPHSHITRDSTFCHVLMPSDLGFPRDDSITGIIAPDAGAAARARSFRDALCPDAELIQCTKSRDSHTGHLSNYSMPPLPKAGRYFVVDDICDGGRTFNLLADAYAEDAAAKDSELMLFVSHGIFSQGIDAISPHYFRITTTDSWCRDTRSYGGRLYVIPLLPKLLAKIEGVSNV
jgi:ribose-phosphate pyrophosphokinase